MTIEVVEVQRRSRQGATRPFLCKADDGNLYFVKGRGAGYRSLICEWIVGCLGRRLGLPIPPFEILEVPSQLLELPNDLGLAELGAGPVFGSRMMQVNELTTVQLEKIPDAIQLDILAFDWWVHNADRTLTENGGNPNLFIEPSTANLVVLDHNLAFDPEFKKNEVLQYHAFRNQKDRLLGDLVNRQLYTEKFGDILSCWSDICEMVPEQWKHFDGIDSIETNFSFETAIECLRRHEQDSFWTEHD